MFSLPTGVSSPSWRAHALDGALLLFHGATGTNVRIAGPGTRPLVRRVPRTVLFGLSNACNLTCSFCSRDVTAPTTWSPESAFVLLAGLARHGVLEVAFGGGEPFVAPGFEGLLERLAEETALVANVTTNGTRIDAARAARLRGRVGEVRVSLYDDNAWERTGRVLQEAGVRAGANVLVTPASLRTLPAILARAAAAGYSDVALLSYVGADRASLLGDADLDTLAERIAESPLPVRVSSCLAPRLRGVPLASAAGCGAGRDYLTITSDGRLKGCSFPRDGVPVATAEDVVAAWHHHRGAFAAPVALGGCGRGAEAAAHPLEDGITAWRAYASNNSGDCVLVGRFEAVADAEAFVRDLLPGWKPGKPFSPEWMELLAAERIVADPYGFAPEQLGTLGAAVLAHSSNVLEDNYAALRTRVWRRHGRVVYNGIHEHTAVVLLTGLRVPPAHFEEAKAALELLGLPGAVVRRGADLYTTLRGKLDVALPALRALATRFDGLVAGELFPEPLALGPALTARPPAGREWLFASFDHGDAAAAAARTIDGPTVTLAGRYLLVGGRVRPRTARHMHGKGARACALIGDVLHLTFECWDPSAARVEPLVSQGAEARLRLGCGPALELRVGATRRDGVRGQVTTADPARALRAVVEAAEGLGLRCDVELDPPDRAAAAIARIAADLDRQARARRPAARTPGRS
jgi:MoaA/NifB/PqqE/SkfB family radical SAM enzyme